MLVFWKIIAATWKLHDLTSQKTLMLDSNMQEPHIFRNICCATTSIFQIWWSWSIKHDVKQNCDKGVQMLVYVFGTKGVQMLVHVFGTKGVQMLVHVFGTKGVQMPVNVFGTLELKSCKLKRKLWPCVKVLNLYTAVLC